MYRCLECGNLFEEGEQAKWTEDRGEFWGSPCSEDMSGCPLCKGAYEEIKPCKICGSYNHDYDEDYCKECKKDISIRLDKLLDRIKTEYKDEFEEAEREYLSECDYDWGALDGALVAAVEDEKNA